MKQSVFSRRAWLRLQAGLGMGAGFGLMMPRTGLAEAGKPDAADLLRATDAIRNPDRPFSFELTLTEFRAGREVGQAVFRVYSRTDARGGRFRNLIGYLAPPQDGGKLMLQSGAEFWFYDPSSKASVRISPQQRLLGQAANGDVLTVNLARDYDVKIGGAETVADGEKKNQECWKLLLTEKSPDVTYHRIEMWVRKSDSRPVKARFYSEGGKLLKTAFYRRFEPALGADRPTEVIIIDGLDKQWVTIMSYRDHRLHDTPDTWFQRDNLPNIQLDE